MLYDEATSSSLRPWLVRTLQPICDADPEALADYVLALLKHDAAEPDLRKMFVGQLEEFLEKEASKFVDALFSTLRTKSYLPYESVKADPSDGGIPIPFDALLSSSGSSDRGRKRNLEGQEHDHPPPKGPRLGEGHFTRYSPSSGRIQSRSHRGHMNGRSMGRGDSSPPMNGHGSMDVDPNVSHAYRPPGGGYGGPRRRGICRDYHNNGFCARGSLCQYNHGDDAVIPPMPYANGPGMPGGGIPFMPMFDAGALFGGTMGGAAYDPHESHMEMGPRHGRGGRIPMAPRQVDAGPDNNAMQDVVPSTSGELPVIQDLTPRDPADETVRSDLPLQPNGFTHNFGKPRRTQPMGLSPRNNGPVGFGDVMGGQMALGAGMMSMPMMPGGMTGGGGFRRQGRGSFAGENHSFRSGSRDDKTLVVEKIPEDKLTLEAVNEWFKRFGTVTNVAIDASSAKALVSFTNNEEAHAAWKSEEAVFGNRFVKLFWHRPMEGQGGFGQRALAASAPLVRNIAAQDSSLQTHPQQPESPQPQPSTSSTPMKTPQKPNPATAAALAARQQLLERQISEQKVLMSRLSTASSPEEKQEIMARIRSIQNDMKPSESQVSPDKVANGSQKSLSERERLDQELELHNAMQGVSDGGGDESSNTAALKEKLERLKAEASRIGVPEAEINAGSSSYSSPYRPYRGRGFRARGYFRGGVGRGGPPRASMKLDNRPRKLLIQGVPATDEAVHAVRTHYQNLGNVESFWSLSDGEAVVQFWGRSAAEQALASGTDIPSVGKVKVSWHTGAVPAQAPSIAAQEPSSPDMEVKTELDNKMDASETRADHEDGGWGHSYDDEDEGRRRRSRSRSSS